MSPRITELNLDLTMVDGDYVDLPDEKDIQADPERDWPEDIDPRVGWNEGEHGVIAEGIY